MKGVRVVILPGNGCTDVQNSNWYGWLADQLRQHYEGKAFECRLENMPDPYVAKESVWLPFIRSKLLSAEHYNIVVGHSSGAEAGMRLCEDTSVTGLILVSACHTDLGMPSEAKAGYYNRPWQWEKIKANTEFRVQLGSTNDRFIPWEEMIHVRDSLSPVDFHEFKLDHFMFDEFPQLEDIVKEKVDSYLSKID